MPSIQQNPPPVITPHYITGRELNRRFNEVWLDPAKCLQLALDLQAGRLIITKISARKAQRLDEFVTAATGAVVAAAARV